MKTVAKFEAKNPDSGKLTHEELSSQIKAHVEGYKAKYKNTPNLRTDSGLAQYILGDLEELTARKSRLNRAVGSKAPTLITLGELVNKAYGIPTDKDKSCNNFLKFLGVNPASVKLSDLLQGNIDFLNTGSDSINKNYRWLISEIILDPVRAGAYDRSIYTELIIRSQAIPSDSVVIPYIRRSAPGMQYIDEEAGLKASQMSFDQTEMEVQTIGTGFEITDKLQRNTPLNMIQEFLRSVAGDTLSAQQTNAAISRLINGNVLGDDSIPVVGVKNVGTLDYDNDWLNIVIGMGQLGYSPSIVLGRRAMIQEVMALPEFKGFDGQTVKADVSMPRILLPSQYSLIPTGAMPAVGGSGGQLLFLDPSAALMHYTSKPLTVEDERNPAKLLSNVYVSGTTLFVKQMTDASMILDTSQDVTAAPFPAEFDAEETIDQETF